MNRPEMRRPGGEEAWSKRERRSFFKKIFSTFRIEAQEHIGAMSSGLIALEKAQDPERQMQIVEMVFREAHSLKGAARSVNMEEIETICQELEGIFALLKRRELEQSPELIDVLHKAVDSLPGLIIVPEIEHKVQNARGSEPRQTTQRYSRRWKRTTRGGLLAFSFSSRKAGSGRDRENRHDKIGCPSRPDRGTPISKTGGAQAPVRLD